MMDKEITTGDDLDRALAEIMQGLLDRGCKKKKGIWLPAKDDSIRGTHINEKDVPEPLSVNQILFIVAMHRHMPSLNRTNIGNRLAVMLAKKRVIGNN